MTRGESARADAVLLHVAPVELERQQCDGERVLDQAPGPAFGDVVDVQACGVTSTAHTSR